MDSARGKAGEETITRLADRIDNYERYTKPHSRVMAELAARLARRMGLSQTDINSIVEAAMLHDIGLFAMNPPYYGSPRHLSFDERLDMWRHPVVGEQQMSRRGAPRHAQLLVRWHHECWNGSGYPDALSFEDIPIGARILRAVDLLSALISDRPYRAALTDEQAIGAIEASAGIECDPYVIASLLALIEDLRKEIEKSESQKMIPMLVPPPISEPALNNPSLFSPWPDQSSSSDKPLDAQSQIDAYSDFASYNPENVSEATPMMDRPQSDPAAAGYMLQSASESNPRILPAVEALIARDKDFSLEDAPAWREWNRTRYNRKSLLGFEVSVLGQIDFRSIAIAFGGGAKLEWYMKAWGRQIHSNDPRAWAAFSSKAIIESRSALDEETISNLLDDLYVPRARLTNPQLRNWFSEIEAGWMDNLRLGIDHIEDEALRAQAIYIGLQTGDYALSFDEAARDLRRPLTTIFWQMAGRFLIGPVAQPGSRSYNVPVEEFASQVRTDLFYLNLPATHAEVSGSESRSEWRESWVKSGDTGAQDAGLKILNAPQSKQTYLAMIDRILRSASHIRKWAIECQEAGLASAHDVSELIKEYRPIRATYSKDLTEIAGGLRNYVIVADRV